MENPLNLFRGSWSPFREIAKMQSALDRMLEDFPEAMRRSDVKAFHFSPSCEVSENESQYVLKFDIPGVSKDQVKIELIENELTVSAERKEEKKKETKNTLVSEIHYGSYVRSFNLPCAVDEKKVDASYQNGVLTITVPKTESAKAKQIAIH